MSTTIDYSKRTTPAFDAIEDIKDWLGQKLKHCGAFAMYASLAGVKGYPIVAWYELYHGQGSWKPDELE